MFETRYELTRYYQGDPSDLDGKTREQVKEATLEYYHQAEDALEDTLNEVYGPVEVCGITFDAGSVFRTLDPIAFRCEVSDQTEEIDLEDYPSEDDDTED